MTTTPSRASGERSSDSCDAPSPIGDSLLRETQSTTIKALAEMVRLCMPDHLPDKVGDLEIIPREPVMEQVTRIRGAWDKVSLYLAQRPQSVGAPVADEVPAFSPAIERALHEYAMENIKHGREENNATACDEAELRLRVLLAAAPTAPVSPSSSERNEGGGEAVAWDSWELAQQVRTDLDREACPNAFMQIAADSVLRYFARHPAPTASDNTRSLERFELRLTDKANGGEMVTCKNGGWVRYSEATASDATLGGQVSQSEIALREALEKAAQALERIGLYDEKPPGTSFYHGMSDFDEAKQLQGICALWSSIASEAGDEARSALDAAPPAEHEAREPGICLADIARVRDDDPDNGRWITCSGCHETVDGQDVLGYPYSALLGYTQGSGCHECGGIGAKWDTTNYEEFARFCEERDAKPAEPVAAPAQVTTPTMEACLQVIREVVSDVRHACSVDGYTHAQGRFLHSIADRIEQAALIGGTLRSQGGVAREAEVHPASMYGLVRDKANAIERGREQIVQAAWDTPATWASDPLPVKSGALAPQHGPQATLTEGGQ